MSKISSSPVRNYIQSNGFVMVSNLLIDFQEELGITESELMFIIKIMRMKHKYSVHDRELDPNVCSKTIQRKRASLKSKGYLNYCVIKSQDPDTGLFRTEGVSYDLGPLEEKLQAISDRMKERREKEIDKEIAEEGMIVEDFDNSPIEKYRRDYKEYYGVDYTVSDYEAKKYNELPDEDKECISRIFDFCGDRDLFGKIVPRLSLFFKTRFRFDELKRYCGKLKRESDEDELPSWAHEYVMPDFSETVNEIYDSYHLKKYDYAFYKAVERLVYKFMDEKTMTLPPIAYEFIEKAYKDQIGEDRC